MPAERVYATALTARSVKAAECGSRESLSVQFAASTPLFKRAKVLIVARLAGVAVQVEEDSAELEGAASRTCVLVTKEGPVTQSNAVVRYLAALRPEAEMYGSSHYEEAVVDEWLEMSVMELEVAVMAVMEHGSVVRGAAKADVEKACKALDAYLATRTYLASERTTAADVAVVCALHAAFTELALVDPKTLVQHYAHLVRWYLTCRHAFRPELGEEKVVSSVAPKTGGSVAPPPKAGGSVAAKPRPAEDALGLLKPQFARSRTRLKELLARGESAVGAEVTVKGWVRSVREAEKGRTNFVELNDGSCLSSIQVVASKASTTRFETLKSSGGAGASLAVTGEVVASMGKGQAIEVRARSVTVLGPTRGGENRSVGAQYYPLAKKFHTADHLRTHAHLRPRSRLGSAVVRVRHALAFATHEFFNAQGFLYIHTPLITAADCEGAGEQFTVTTLLADEGKPADVPLTATGAVDYSKDFFGKKTGLTVSGQLNVETHAVSLADCYTFGPTFRAENSHTTRHLAEFWMIEPEMAFADLRDDIHLASDYLKYCVAAVLSRCDEDLAFFEQTTEKGLRDRLRRLVADQFNVLQYTEAIAVLQRAVADGTANFVNTDIVWGMDLNSEHERFLTEVVYGAPVVLVDYPKDIKAFYMKLNPVTDPAKQTVAAMDILVPKIGEIIGGSQREDDLELLEERAAAVGIDPKSLSWYSDLRLYGSVPHAGFGLGFERLIMLCTGVENIRDVIPFPRYPGHCDF